MQGAFIQSQTYSPPIVLGRQLLPLSSWHGLLLEAAGSPYLLGGAPKLDDLVFGIWVCSHSYIEGYAAASDVVAARKWGRQSRLKGVGQAREDFEEYIKASFLTPQYWAGGKNESLRAPCWWHLAFFGMHKLHLAEVQAWDYPIAKIACYQACYSETQGGTDLMTEEDIKGQTILKQEKEL